MAGSPTCTTRPCPLAAPHVPVKDGWYDDDTGGGVAVWGDGGYFELRDTLFSVRPD